MQLKENFVKELITPTVVPHKIEGVIIQNNKINIVIELSSNTNYDDQNLTLSIKKIIENNFPDKYTINVIYNQLKTPSSSVAKKDLYKIPNIKNIVLFASTKGGVGKSTTAAYIALALAKLGQKVGIVDADIYGPSLPTLLGITTKPEVIDNKIIPIYKNGIYSISMGYLIEENQAAIWRGPMISKALSQLLLSTKWPELDYLIIDMPPGTGDIYLSLSEKFIIDGAVLITTPQKISFSILKKSIGFFNKAETKILGLIENMSYLTNPIDNSQIHVFGPPLSEHQLKNISIELLGRIPLSSEISTFGDEGLSLKIEHTFTIYKEIASIINEKLKK